MTDERDYSDPYPGAGADDERDEPALPSFPQEADYEESGDMAALWGAFAKAQGGFEPVLKTKHVQVVTKTGPPYEFDYAPLDEVLAKCLPSLNANGLALIQPYSGLQPGKTLRTMLVHGSGAKLTLKVRIPSAGKIQELGSTLTYIRRYSVQCLLGVNAEDDDDGNAADGNAASKTDKKPATNRQQPPPPKPEPAKVIPGQVTTDTKAKLWALFRAAGFNASDAQDFSTTRDCGPLSELTEVNAEKLITAAQALKVQS